MPGSQFRPSPSRVPQNLGGISDSLAWPGKKIKTGGDAAEVKSVSTPTLDPEDKALFLEVWGLRHGELTDEQILIAINLGHL